MNPCTPVNIILADQHEIFRDGFRSLIRHEPGIKLVAEAGDGYTLLTETARFSPDIVITDIKMPGLNGIQVTEILAKKFPQTAVIALSMSNEDNLVIDMLIAGAKAFLLKDAGKKTILDAIFAVSRGHSFFCPSTALTRSRLIANGFYDPHRNERITPLSKREIEILNLLCHEKTSMEIADQLHLSLRTVEGFRQKLRLKTDTGSLIGIYRFAVHHGLFKTDQQF